MSNKPNWNNIQKQRQLQLDNNVLIPPPEYVINYLLKKFKWSYQQIIDWLKDSGNSYPFKEECYSYIEDLYTLDKMNPNSPYNNERWR